MIGKVVLFGAGIFMGVTFAGCAGGGSAASSIQPVPTMTRTVHDVRTVHDTKLKVVTHVPASCVEAGANGEKLFEQIKSYEAYTGGISSLLDDISIGTYDSAQRRVNAAEKRLRITRDATDQTIQNIMTLREDFKSSVDSCKEQK